MTIFLGALTFLAVLFLVVAVCVVFSYFGTWLQAQASDAHISFWRLLMMSLRHVPSSLIVRCYIQLRKAGITNISTDELESHYMAHGNVERVVNAMVAADKAAINLTFRQAAAIDLATRSFTNQEGVSRAIFVITDGEDNEGGAVEAAKEAAKKGMRVYMLGIGDPNGAPIPQQGSSNYILDEEGNVVVSKLNEDMCREIAKAGNGSYIYVDNSSSAQVKLNEQINRLAKTRMESQMYNDYDEQFQGFVLLGLMFLLLDIMLQERENQRFNFSKIFSRRMKS